MLGEDLLTRGKREGLGRKGFGKIEGNAEESVFFDCGSRRVPGTFT